MLLLNLLNCVNSNPVTNVTQAKNKHHQLKKKIQETKIHAIRYFPAGSFAVHIGDHVRFGIICGPIWGSFAALYRVKRICALYDLERAKDKTANANIERTA